METKNGNYANDRIVNLLETAGIQGNEIINQNWEEQKKITTDWVAVKNNLAIRQRESIEFIKDSLK